MYFDHLYPPISFEGETLSPYSSKMDVIVPILDLEGEAENFILDLHYSLNHRRYRTAGVIARICKELLTRIMANRAFIVLELEERLPQWSAVEILEAWGADIQRMISVTSNSAPDHPVSWIREE